MTVIESPPHTPLAVETAVAAAVEVGLTGVEHAAVLQGNGNVIAVIELAAREQHPREVLTSAAVAVATAVRSVRVDGVLFFYPRHPDGLRMVFHDRDGTWEAMCGNGLRCLARYAADRGLIAGSGVVVTDDGPKVVRVDGEDVEVVLGAQRQVRRLAPDRWFAYNGVAHLVVFVGPDELGRIDVPVEGARLRYDAALCTELGHPHGVHVNFAAVEPGGLAVRTYEVGVEDETSCCGTGVTASAALAALSGRVRLPVAVRTPGGLLRVSRQGRDLTLAGPTGYLAGHPRALDLIEANLEARV